MGQSAFMHTAASLDSARRVYLPEGMGTWPGSTSKNSHPFFRSQASPYVGWSCSESQGKPDLCSSPLPPYLDLWWQVGGAGREPGTGRV